MKYQVNMFYSLQVEASSEAEAEEKAGEYIQIEIIYHKNGDKTNNRIENLKLTTQKGHSEVDKKIQKGWFKNKNQLWKSRVADPRC